MNVELIKQAKKSGESFKINPTIIQKEIKSYFTHHQAIVDVKEKYNLSIIEIHGKDLILDPKGILSEMCKSLEVNCSSDYLEICSNKIFRGESRTRDLIQWTDEQLTLIQQNIEKYSSLKGYNSDSM